MFYVLKSINTCQLIVAKTISSPQLAYKFKKIIIKFLIHKNRSKHEYLILI